MLKSTVLLLVWLCSATTILAQESGDFYLSMTTQIGVTRNRLIEGEPMQSNPTAFYNGFKFGFFVAPKVVLAFEYSAFSIGGVIALSTITSVKVSGIVIALPRAKK